MSGSMLHAVLIISVEIILLLILLGAFLFFRSRKKGKQDSQAAEVLIERVTDGEADRRDSLVKIFSEVYGIEGDELQAMVNQFVSREKAFYKVLLSTYLNRDADKLPDFVSELENMVLPYVELVPPDKVDASEIEALNAELDELRDQNTDLDKELKINKGIIEEMMSEYTAAFDKGVETDKPLPAPAPQEQEAEEEDSVAEPEAATEALVELDSNSFEDATDAEEVEPAESAEPAEGEGNQEEEVPQEEEVQQDEEVSQEEEVPQEESDILSDDELDALFDVPDESAAITEPVSAESESPEESPPADVDTDEPAPVEEDGESELEELAGHTMSRDELNLLFDAPVDEPLPNESDVIDIDLGDIDEPPPRQEH